MMRRNILVERNRRRQERYAPTREALLQEDLRIAQERHDTKMELEKAWKSRAIQIPMSRPDRPLPGGGPRSTRRAETETQRNPTSYKQEKAAENEKKAAYQKLYEEDMRQQLADRRAVLQKVDADEKAQLAVLREIHEEQGRMYAEEELRKEKEQKEYTERLHKANIREQERKREHQKEHDRRMQDLDRAVRQNNAHQAEMDERQRKNAVKTMQLMNEEARIEAIKHQQSTRERDTKEMEILEARNRRLAQEDVEYEEGKKARFRKEFEDCVRRDKEFRALHNYDEPIEVTRMKDEQSAESWRLLQTEMRLRDEENRRSYKKDLLKQIKTKQDYELKHFDGA